MRRIELFGVGPQRAGTSWLHACLLEHPQPCFPAGVKETAFLSLRFSKGWSWCWSHFRHWRQGQLCAEIRPQAFDYPEAAQRLWKHNPSCRIILSLRDPAERSFSMWLHPKRKGYVDCDFRAATERVPAILGASHYRDHVKRWLELFGEQRLLFTLLQDIASSPKSVLEQVYDFAGIDGVPAPAAVMGRPGLRQLPVFPRVARLAARGGNWLRDRRMYGPIELAKSLGLRRLVFGGSAAVLPTLDLDMRRQLIKEFEPDITYVEQLLGRQLDRWRQVGGTGPKDSA